MGVVISSPQERWQGYYLPNGISMMNTFIEQSYTGRC